MAYQISDISIGISISISIGHPILGYKVADIILAKNFGTTLVKSLPP